MISVGSVTGEETFFFLNTRYIWYRYTVNITDEYQYLVAYFCTLVNYILVYQAKKYKFLPIEPPNTISDGFSGFPRHLIPRTGGRVPKSVSDRLLLFVI